MKKQFAIYLLAILIPALVGCSLVRSTDVPATTMPVFTEAPTEAATEVPTEAAEPVTEAASPEQLPVPETVPAAPLPGDVLTADNCLDFSNVLSAQHTDNDRFRDFAQQYDNRIVKFDGCITAIEAHGHDEYQIQVRAGDYNSGGTYSGPTFVLEIDNDDHWQHQQAPTFSVGQNVTIQAEVDDFETYSRLFELDDISIVTR